MITWRGPSVTHRPLRRRSLSASSCRDTSPSAPRAPRARPEDDQRGVADHVGDARRADREHARPRAGCGSSSGRRVSSASSSDQRRPLRRPTWPAPRRPSWSTAPRRRRRRGRRSLSRLACTESAERSARRRALRLTLKVCERGFGPKATPPPRRCGTLSAPARARPVPFWCQALAVVIETSPRPRRRRGAAAASREVRARGLVHEALVEVLAEDGRGQVGLGLLAERRSP